MQAFKNDPAIKEALLQQLQAHYDADEIIKGKYWHNGKGCALGCTVHGKHHDMYKEKWDIPIELAYLEDTIFDGLRNSLSKEWPLQFIQAIPVGADLSDVWPKFAVWLLTDAECGVLKYAKTDQEKEAIQRVADLYSRYQTVTTNEWKDASWVAGCARAVANAAAASAYAAVFVAEATYAAGHPDNSANSYDDYASAYAAANAAVASAYAVANAAVASAYAVANAVYAAAYAAVAVHDATHAEAYEAQSKKLLELLKECK